MTIAGWVPWLLDGLDVAGQDVYDTYIQPAQRPAAPGPGPSTPATPGARRSAVAAMVGASAGPADAGPHVSGM
jgi:hypothetical protein